MGDAEEEKPAKFLFLMKKAPHGSIYPYEGLEVILIMAAYDQLINVAFVEDGVLSLVKGQDTSAIGVKDFSNTLRILEDYGVEHLYVDKESLEARGLKEEDLITPVEVVEKEKISSVMREQDVVLPF
ncbi:MAG: sulfurtransferase TusC [bacterium]|nr:MAG: sulfurtransferase TusC [bacterium]